MNEHRSPMMRDGDLAAHRPALECRDWDDEVSDTQVRRWTRLIIAADLGGLPLLLLLTPWAWYVAVVVWLASLAGLMLGAVWAMEATHRQRAGLLQRQVALLLELSASEAALPRGRGGVPAAPSSGAP